MSTVPDVSSTSTTAPQKTQDKSDFGLGKDDFLKILMAQMRNLDPLSSSGQDSDKYVQQMTQYSILEQLTNLNVAVEAQQADAANEQAIGLIGRTVKYVQAGQTVEGTVASMQVGADGVPTLTIGSTTGVGLGQILEVK